MTKEELIKEINEIGHISEAAFYGSGKIPPIFTILNADGKRGIFQLLESQMANRRLALRHIGNHLLKGGYRADAIIFASEAWMVKKSNQEYEQLKKEGKEIIPSEDPRREEKFIISGLTYSGSAHNLVYNIVNKDNRRLIKLDSESTAEMNDAAPNLNSLLNEFFQGVYEGVAGKLYQD